MFHSFHFTILLVCYSVDPKLSEKHNFISIAISGGLALFLSYFDWTIPDIPYINLHTKFERNPPMFCKIHNKYKCTSFSCSNSLMAAIWNF